MQAHNKEGDGPFSEHSKAVCPEVKTQAKKRKAGTAAGGKAAKKGKGSDLEELVFVPILVEDGEEWVNAVITQAHSNMYDLSLHPSWSDAILRQASHLTTSDV